MQVSPKMPSEPQGFPRTRNSPGIVCYTHLGTGPASIRSWYSAHAGEVACRPTGSAGLALCARPPWRPGGAEQRPAGAAGLRGPAAEVPRSWLRCLPGGDMCQPRPLGGGFPNAVHSDLLQLLFPNCCLGLRLEPSARDQPEPDLAQAPRRCLWGGVRLRTAVPGGPSSLPLAASFSGRMRPKCQLYPLAPVSPGATGAEDGLQFLVGPGGARRALRRLGALDKVTVSRRFALLQGRWPALHFWLFSSLCFCIFFPNFQEQEFRIYF